MPNSGNALVTEGLSIDRAAPRSTLHERSLCRAINDGRFAARKFGRRTVILSDDLNAFLKDLPAAGQKVPASESGRDHLGV